MKEEASPERPIVNGEVSNEHDTILVYDGHLTNLFQSRGMSMPYYTKIMDALK
jgi:hypothetical protein